MSVLLGFKRVSVSGGYAAAAQRHQKALEAERRRRSDGAKSGWLKWKQRAAERIANGRVERAA